MIVNSFRGKNKLRKQKILTVSKVDVTNSTIYFSKFFESECVPDMTYIDLETKEIWNKGTVSIGQSLTYDMIENAANILKERGLSAYEYTQIISPECYNAIIEHQNLCDWLKSLPKFRRKQEILKIKIKQRRHIPANKRDYDEIWLF